MAPWRREVRKTDVEAVRRLVAATGYFHPEEIGIAVELVEETLADPQGAGYHFLFADGAEGAVVAYSCFGPIPMTVGSWDLYWIAVDPHRQGSGLGRLLLRESERSAQAAGARRMYVETSGRPQYAPTRGFYERCGYAKIAELDDFYAPGDSKVLYCLRLAGVTEEASSS
jgi:ribosomal protein S18 acetylase RimI-like enzyme